MIIPNIDSLLGKAKVVFAINSIFPIGGQGSATFTKAGPIMHGSLLGRQISSL